MIALETTQEGFEFSIDGRCVLSHSRRNPCVEIGRSEGAIRISRGSGLPRRRPANLVALRSYKVAERDPEFLAIDFDGRLRMSLRMKEGRLRISFSRYDASINHFRLRLSAWPDEHVYGCGERAERLDLKGLVVPLWVRDRGGIGDSAVRLKIDPRGHFPMPVFLSSRGYWCAIDTSAYAELDFRRRTATVLSTWAVPRELVLGFGPDAPELLSGMATVLGRQPEPPSWCFDGICLGLSGGSSEIEDKLAWALGAGIKVASIWIQDWCGRRAAGTGLPKDWSRDENLYPDLPDLTERLRARGIRCLGSVGPLLPAEGRLYAEASSAGLCVKDGEGRDYRLAAGNQTAAAVDLSSAAGCAWMKDLLRRELLDAGMSGWAADYGEQLPVDAVLASGEDAARTHNRWPALWAKVNREAIEESGRAGEAFFFMRSGWLGAARYAQSFFAGEREPGFSRRDGLASVVPAALSLGLSGAGFWHSETGGTFASAAGGSSRECLRRWMELSAFTPFFRMGEGSAVAPDVRSGFDPETLSLLARMSEVYATLKPYHVAAVSEYSREGLPPMRHPWIHYGSDPQTYGLVYQYLYGRDLMVAPALAQSQGFTELYLPEGEWVHLWTSRSFRSGRVAVESPSGCPAVFYRAESGFARLFDALRRGVRRV